MRIWDIPPKKLCRAHLLGEHRELHAIWAVLTKNKKGYSHHPETLRWKGRLRALYRRHEAQVQEMTRRGYCHKSPLSARFCAGSTRQAHRINTLQEQIRLLQRKGCPCAV